MIVNYDKKKGFGTLLSGLKQDSTSISDEFAKLSTQIKDLPLKDLPNTGNWQKWAESMNYTDKSLLKFLSDVDSGNKSIRDLNTYMQSATQKTTTFQRGMSALKSIGGTLLSAGINMAAIWAISAAIEGIATSIYNWVNADKIAIEKGQEAQDNIKARFKEYTNGKKTVTDLGKSFAKSVDDIKTTDDAIDSVAKKYTELSKGVNQFTNENNNLSTDNYQVYLDTCNQLAEQFPSLVSGYDAQGNAMLNLGSNADSAAQSIRNLYEAQMLSANAEIGQNLQTSFEGVLAQIKQYEQDIANYKASASTELINPASAAVQAKKKQSIELDTKDLGEQTTDYYNQIVESLQKAGLKYQEYTSEYLDTETGKLEQKIGFSMIDGTTEQLQSFYDDIGSKSGEFYDKQISQRNDYLQKTSSTQMMIDDQWKSMSESIGQYLQTSESFTKLDTKIQDAFIGNLANIDLSALSSEYDGQVLPFLYGEFIEPLTNLQPEAQKALSNLFTLEESELTTGDYYNQVQQALESAFPDDKDMQKKWRDNFGISDIIKENARETGTLKNMFKDNIAEIDAMTNGEHKIAYDLVINDGFSGTFEELKEAMKTSTASSDYSLESMQEKVTSAQTALSNFSSAISESQSTTGLTADSISTLKDQFQGLTAEGQALEGMDLNSLFKNTADGVKLNSDAMQGLVEAQHKADSQNFADSIKYQKDEISKQKDELSKLTKGTDEYILAQEKLKQLQSDLSGIQQAQSQYQALYNQQKELFTNYAEWQQAQSTENAGDKYTSMVSGLKSAKELFDKGLVGTDDFKSFAKLISPTGATDAENFAENYGKATRYLTETDKGVKNFLNDLDSKGLAEFNAETQQWSYNIKDMAEAAQQMGISEEFMSAMFGRLEDYGFHNNFISDAQEGVLKLTDTYGKLYEAEKDLQNLEKNDSGNTTAISAKREEIESYKRDIEELKQNLSTIGQQTSEDYNNEVESAKQVAEAMSRERQRILEENTYGTNTQSVADKMQDDINQLEETYHFTLTPELNTSSISSEIENMSENQTIIFEAELDDGSLAKIEATKDEKGQITYTANVDGVQYAISSVVENEDGTITYIANIDGVETELTSVKNEDGTITYTVNEIQGETIEKPEDDVKTITVNEEQGKTVDSSQDDVKNLTVNETLGETVDTVPDATGTANFTLGDSPEEVPDASGIANFDLGTSPLTVPDATGIANFTLGTYPTSVPAATQIVNQIPGLKLASGTMTSIAHADGTMHNAPWNYHNLSTAYANGKVSLPKDEKALVNELGQESIIRNGVWSLIPGKMHVENLKKNDIILNAKQTSELLKFGKTNSHARAYAEGTIPYEHFISNSYAGGSGYGSFKGGASYTGNPLSNTKAQDQNTSATNSNTSATQSNTEATEKSTEAMNWVERGLKALTTTFERYANQINDYISSTLKVSLLKKQLSTIDKQLEANQKGYDTYMAKANSINISSEYKDLVKNGAFKIEDIDTSTEAGKKLAEDIRKYQEWYEKMPLYLVINK